MKKFKDWSKPAKTVTITGAIGLAFCIGKEGVKLISRAINRKADGKAKKADRQDELNKKKEYEAYKAEKQKEAVDYSIEKRREEEERKRAEADKMQQEQNASMGTWENTEPLPPVDQDLNSDADMVGNRLFDKIIHKGEMGMFVGPKGCGKSLIADWIALNIAEGKNVPVWSDVEGQTVGNTKVLVYDLELFPVDIHERFIKYGYVFPENFIRHDRAQIKSPKDILSDLNANVEQAQSGNELFAVVDNIKKVVEISCAQVVKSFMDSLDAISNKAKAKGVALTILIVNHPTKDIQPGDSIKLGDEAGSTYLRDFLNFIFAVEPTNITKQHKILKVLTIRGEVEPEDVAILKIVNEAPYVHPVVLCEMEESKALTINNEQLEAHINGLTVKSDNAPTDKRKVNKTGLTDDDKREIYRKHTEDGISPEELAKEYGPKCKKGTVSDTTIRNIIDKMKAECDSEQQQSA